MLLCSLLFVEEVGVPLPIPGELTLIAAGLLIATGALDPWLFAPLAVASCLTGSLLGYSWARLAGEHGLRATAARFHQTKRLDQVTARLQRAGPRELAVSRLIPGLRVYTTLVAGAVLVERRKFLLGIAPATVVWVTAFLVLGVVAGVPAERFLGQLQGLVLEGGILILLGLGSYVAIRRVPEHSVIALGRLSTSLRALLAAAVDMALIGAVVAGVLAIVRPLTPAGAIAGWLDIVVVVIVIAAFYSVATRAGRQATAGERLLDASYITQGAENASRQNLRTVARSLMDGDGDRPESDIGRTAAMFRALGDAKRLRVVRLLLAEDRSSEEVAEELHLSAPEATYALRELQLAGLTLVQETAAGQRHAISSDQIRVAVLEMLEGAPPGKGLGSQN
ncbi:MAG: VTT domain-containing protein [Candidatus Dormibacter sp.]|uniref:VTT domain-containing protein n=1 Tax=Candidatus Dormibacter sp. TaxID=2973982 RepID=UPI00268B99A2